MKSKQECGCVLKKRKKKEKRLPQKTKDTRAPSCLLTPNEGFLLMSANLQRNPRLWCHLILKVGMLYGICNAFSDAWSTTHTECACLCECLHMHICVWLGYRVCLHYTLFSLIWLALNRYWFPLFCSLRLSHILSLFLSLPSPFLLLWLCASNAKADPMPNIPNSAQLCSSISHGTDI